MDFKNSKSRKETPEKASPKKQEMASSGSKAAKGSNHKGQSSGGDSTHQSSPKDQPARRGNSSEDQADKKADQNLAKKLGTDIDTDEALKSRSRLQKADPAKSVKAPKDNAGLARP